MQDAPAPAIQEQAPPGGSEPAPPADGASQPQSDGQVAGSASQGETSAPDAARSTSPTSGFIAVGLLIGLVVLLGLAILAMRKHLLSQDASDRGHAGFMDELRRSLRDGRISQEEYDAARKAMVARLTGQATPEKSPQRGRGSSAPDGPAG